MRYLISVIFSILRTGKDICRTQIILYSAIWDFYYIMWVLLFCSVKLSNTPLYYYYIFNTYYYIIDINFEYLQKLKDKKKTFLSILWSDMYSS